ncbi:MAG: TolC family outer membrane protein [Pseudomonadota bacterium]
MAVSFGMAMQAKAQSFDEALRMAYETNPTIAAARAEQRSVDELMPQARGGFLPTLSGQAFAGISSIDTEPGGDDTIEPRGGSLEVTQFLFRGGRTIAEIDQAENSILAQRGILTETTQDILLSAAATYFNVVRDQAVVELNKNNESVLDQQLQASRDRFDVGEVTRTDVSQSESRRARAVSDRIAAEGFLEVSRSAFTRVVGQAPEILEQPELDIPVPATLQDAIDLALENNPLVVAARFSEVAAQKGIDAEFADLLPNVSLRASASHNDDSSLFTDTNDVLEMTATINIPIYQAGVATSQVRQAKQTAAAQRRRLDEAMRQATDETVDAWETLQSASAQIVSRDAEVAAAEVALDGVRQEALVGSRTTLDVLDAEQELLDAQVSQVTAVRDRSIALFQLLAATGSLSPLAIGIDVDVYNPEENYDRVRNKLWGVSVD